MKRQSSTTTSVVDEITFFGTHKIPLEVKRIIPILPLLSSRSTNKVIKLVVEYVMGPDLNVYDPKLAEQMIGTKNAKDLEKINKLLETELSAGIEKLKKKSDIEHAKYAQKTGIFSVLFTGFYCILRACIRHKLSSEDFKLQLIHLQLDEKIVNLLYNVIDKQYIFVYNHK